MVVTDERRNLRKFGDCHLFGLRTKSVIYGKKVTVTFLGDFWKNFTQRHGVHKGHGVVVRKSCGFTSWLSRWR